MSNGNIDPADENEPAEAGAWKKFCLIASGLVWAWIVVRAIGVALGQSGSPASQAIYLILMFAGGCILAVLTYCLLMFLKLTLSGAARLLRRGPPINGAH
jgi:hypothetical protein